MTTQLPLKSNGNSLQDILIAPMPGSMLLCNEDIMEHIAIACMLCGTDELIGRIRIAWNGRFTARMGDARWLPGRGHGVIRLSLPLWPKASHDERVETITHEACHIIADYKFGGRQMHGPRWHEMMRRCGYENARRCHRVDFDDIRARRLRRRLSVACGCPGGIVVSHIVARRVQAGAAYTCRACGQRLTLHQPISAAAQNISESRSSILPARSKQEVKNGEFHRYNAK